MVIITYCYLVETAFFNLNPKFISDVVLSTELSAKTNSGSFDDPRGVYGNTEEITFGSPINVDQIVFAATREPVAKRVVVDVAFDMLAKGFSVEEETEKPNPEWSRQVARVLDELNTKEKLRARAHPKLKKAH